MKYEVEFLSFLVKGEGKLCHTRVLQMPFHIQK